MEDQKFLKLLNKANANNVSKPEYLLSIFKEHKTIRRDEIGFGKLVDMSLGDFKRTISALKAKSYGFKLSSVNVGNVFGSQYIPTWTYLGHYHRSAYGIPVYEKEE